VTSAYAVARPVNRRVGGMISFISFSLRRMKNGQTTGGHQLDTEYKSVLAARVHTTRPQKTMEPMMRDFLVAYILSSANH
jgi:hypothetical protein